MIGRDEIMTIADQIGLRPQVVEKDYVLGWLLAGIFRDPELSQSFVFKGGTCLKKCYFETYRFSEDLDFTVLEPRHVDKEFLTARFKALSEWLYDETGIEVPADKLSFEIWDTPNGGRAGEGKVSYRGPIAPNNKDLPRIKLDLTTDEKLVMPKTRRDVVFSYTDEPEGGIHAECYAYAEVFGEKVRALAQRTRPRDLYDVINLYRHEEFNIATAVIRDVIKQKCDFKKIPFPTLAAIQPHKDELFADWKVMLAHQLPQLPPAESYWESLKEFFDWLMGKLTRTHLGTYPTAEAAEVVRLPVGAIRLPGRNAAFMEVIRFAAANHLCVELDYTDKQGKRSKRVIEPYSLRRSSKEDLLLMAVKADTGEARSYLVEQIQGAQMTNRSFTPRYQIELTPISLPQAPALERKIQTKSMHWGTKPVHIYRCPMCNRKFEHSTKSAKLHAHKNPSGFSCHGKTGYYETTIYK